MENLFVTSILSMGALGAFFAFGLAFASKKLAVEEDDRIAKIEEILPGANCGACGYPGCSNYASAVVGGEAAVNNCPVGGEKVARLIADIMGVKAGGSEQMVAQVLCQGGQEEADRRSEYRGVETCKAAAALGGGNKACNFGCLGLGDCAAVCPFAAIIINDNGLPEIDPEKCTGCGKCVEACPKNIILLAPITAQNNIRCRATYPGKKVRKICSVGCIGCGLCAKVCPVDAITMEDNLAVLDYDKCINCGLCAEKCPTGTIEFIGKKVKKVEINDDCIGCTLCAKKCPVDAISGELKGMHEIDQEKCIKCGLCYEACRKNAIDIEYED
ncbi:MAG: RnfABCDGE type electron transport complex subunit B [Halanaerobium sp.]|nr:RnfABCDGE type electron transport complex subunit B [Halanaerobium sp.]